MNQTAQQRRRPPRRDQPNGPARKCNSQDAHVPFKSGCFMQALVHACNPDTWEAEKLGTYKLKASLGYMVNSKLAQTQPKSNQMNSKPRADACETTSHTRLDGSHPTGSHPPPDSSTTHLGCKAPLSLF